MSEIAKIMQNETSSESARIALTMIDMHIKQCEERHEHINKRFDKQDEKFNVVVKKIDDNNNRINRLGLWIIAILAGTGGSGLVLNDNVLKFLGSIF